MKRFSDISWFLPAKNRASGFLRQRDAVPKNRCWNTTIITVIYLPVERQSLLLLLALAEYKDFKQKSMVLVARLYHLTCQKECWNISPYWLKISMTQNKFL